MRYLFNRWYLPVLFIGLWVTTAAGTTISMDTGASASSVAWFVGAAQVAFKS